MWNIAVADPRRLYESSRVNSLEPESDSESDTNLSTSESDTGLSASQSDTDSSDSIEVTQDMPKPES